MVMEICALARKSALMSCMSDSRESYAESKASIETLAARRDVWGYRCFTNELFRILCASSKVH